MGGVGVAVASALGGGKVPLTIAFVATLGFVRWALPFTFDQLNKRADRVEAREREVERRMNLRLRHVEAELDAFREATMKLLNVVAEISPGHGALAEVAKILRKTPKVSLELDELAAGLAAMPANERGEA